MGVQEANKGAKGDETSDSTPILALPLSKALGVEARSTPVPRADTEPSGTEEVFVSTGEAQTAGLQQQSDGAAPLRH